MHENRESVATHAGAGRLDYVRAKIGCKPSGKGFVEAAAKTLVNAVM